MSLYRPAGSDRTDGRESGPATPRAAGGHWLNARRLRRYPLIFLIIYLILGALLLTQGQGSLDALGKPIGYDFMSFWSSAKLALAGEPEAAYRPERILETGRSAVPSLSDRFIWSYPPTFQLLVLPLGLLPYSWGYLLWSLFWLIPFLIVIRKLAPAPETLWLTLAFPGTILNLAQGQNGLMMAALLGGAVVLLRSRPYLAGLLIGLMSCKPQLGLLWPIALACGRAWRSFAAAALTTIIFAGIAFLAFGTEGWLAFVDNIPFASAVLEDGRLPWSKMPSAFAASRLLGVGISWAYAAQVLVAVAAALAVAYVWWRGKPFELAAAVLTSGALLVSPHLNDHDLAILAVPIALLAWYGHRHGWRRGEREVLVAAWLSPLVTAIVAAQTDVQLGFLCVLAIFAVAVRRALTTR